MTWNQKTKSIIIDKDGDQAGVDGPVGASKSIAVLHDKIHDGKAYSTGFLEMERADDASSTLFLSTPSDVYCHITLFGSAGGDAIATFHSGAQASGGTVATITNKNFNSSNTSGVSGQYSPSAVTASGTTMWQGLLPGGSKNQAVGAQGEERDEFILKPSTKYLMKLQNIAGAGKNLSLGCTFYTVDV